MNQVTTEQAAKDKYDKIISKRNRKQKAKAPAKKKATAKPITRAEIHRRIDIKTERFRANYKRKAA